MIRKMLENDVSAVALVEADVFSAAWPARIFLEELQNPLAHYLVLEEDNKIIGYAGFWLVLGEAQITNIALLKSCQGRGLGRELVQSLLASAEKEQAEKVILEVRRSNLIAQQLYQSLGFAVIGIRIRYYEDNGEDAFLMEKILKEEENV